MDWSNINSKLFESFVNGYILKIFDFKNIDSCYFRCVYHDLLTNSDSISNVESVLVQGPVSKPIISKITNPICSGLDSVEIKIENGLGANSNEYLYQWQTSENDGLYIDITVPLKSKNVL